MKKQERADLVRRRLNELYPDPPIPLDHRDDFTLLVAVLLSAQCTDKKVNEVTPELFRVAPTPEKMRRLGEDRILAIIRPLGLSRQKAKSLAKLSAHIGRAAWRGVPRTLRGSRSVARRRSQDRERRDGPGLRRPGLSGRHAHPSTGAAVGAFQRQERDANREGSQEGLSRVLMEQASPADHFLRSRALHGARMRRNALRTLPRTLSQQEETGGLEKTVASRRPFVFIKRPTVVGHTNVGLR